MNTADILLGSLATFRITKFLLDDELIREPREKVEDFLSTHQAHPAARKIDYLISCPWCLSPYVALPLTLLALKNPTLFYTVALPLSYSAITGLLYTLPR